MVGTVLVESSTVLRIVRRNDGVIARDAANKFNRNKLQVTQNIILRLILNNSRYYRVKNQIFNI